MKSILTTALLIAAITSYAQQYRYVRIITVQLGIEGKDKATFLMPSMPDSAKYYTGLKINDIMTAVEMMERKGYELVSITPTFTQAVVMTTAYMRRRLP